MFLCNLPDPKPTSTLQMCIYKSAKTKYYCTTIFKINRKKKQ